MKLSSTVDVFVHGITRLTCVDHSGHVRDGRLHICTGVGCAEGATIVLQRIHYRDRGFDEFLLTPDDMPLSEILVNKDSVEAFSKERAAAEAKKGRSAKAGALSADEEGDVDWLGSGGGAKARHRKRWLGQTEAQPEAQQDIDELAGLLEAMMEADDAVDRDLVAAALASERQEQDEYSEESLSDVSAAPDSSGSELLEEVDAEVSQVLEEVDVAVSEFFGQVAAHVAEEAEAPLAEPEAPVADPAQKRRQFFTDYRPANPLDACEGFGLQFHGDIVGGAFIKDSRSSGPALVVLGRLWQTFGGKAMAARCAAHGSQCKLMITIRSGADLSQMQSDVLGWMAAGTCMDAAAHADLARRVKTSLWGMNVRS